MPARSQSRVTSGLNDYRFVASLHVQHPSVDPDDVTATLKRDPKKIGRHGERRRRPDGRMLTGTYNENHWTADLEIVAGHNVPEFLEDLLNTPVSQAIELTRRIDATGGSVTVFIGIFADRLCDFEITASTLRRLGNAGISVRLDYFAGDGHNAMPQPMDEREPE